MRLDFIIFKFFTSVISYQLPNTSISKVSDTYFYAWTRTTHTEKIKILSKYL